MKPPFRLETKKLINKERGLFGYILIESLVICIYVRLQRIQLARTMNLIERYATWLFFIRKAVAWAYMSLWNGESDTG